VVNQNETRQMEKTILLIGGTGDIAACYADVSLAVSMLDWHATRGLDEMCADSWHWQQMNPNGFFDV
jgi:UDP-glucose 4-epimerase